MNNSGQKVCRSKVKYLSRKTAWKWAIYYSKTIGGETGVYRCHYCHKFHLSSKSLLTPSKKALGITEK